MAISQFPTGPEIQPNQSPNRHIASSSFRRQNNASDINHRTVTPKALVFLYEWKREKISIETKSIFFRFFLLEFSLTNKKRKKGIKKKRKKRIKKKRKNKGRWFRSMTNLDAELSIKHSQCSRIFARATLFCESDIASSWAAVSAAIGSRFSIRSRSRVQQSR